MMWESCSESHFCRLEINKAKREVLFLAKEVDRGANFNARALQLSDGSLCIQNKHVGRDGTVVGARVLR